MRILLTYGVGGPREQAATCGVSGGGRDGLACRQRLHEHGARHQRTGAAAETARRLGQGVAGRPPARRQAGLLLAPTPHAHPSAD